MTVHTVQRLSDGKKVTYVQVKMPENADEVALVWVEAEGVAFLGIADWLSDEQDEAVRECADQRVSSGQSVVLIRKADLEQIPDFPK